MRKADLLPCAASLAAILASAAGAFALPLAQPFAPRIRRSGTVPANSVVWLDFSKGKSLLERPEAFTAAA